MKDRIKQIRRAMKLTQVEFGKRIGVAGNTITNYENGVREPSNVVILSICREFNVQEEWLRNGSGEMYKKLTKAGIAANIIESALESKNDFIMNTFITLAQLTPAEWDFFEKIVDRIKDLDKEPLV